MLLSDFYPRSPCGERRARWVYRSRVRLFLSTLSLRRATLLIVAIRGIVLNFYPRSPCGERRSAQFLGAESGYFYPRSPCGERQQLCPLLAIRTNFYPRSPCGERRSDGFHRGAKVAISIHALLAESDYIAAAAAGSCPAFLSTLSLRRATKKPWTTCEILPISIHALLAESDTTGASLQSPTRISIHALLAESDRIKAPKVTRHMNFYPRSPCGERLIVSLLVSMSY